MSLYASGGGVIVTKATVPDDVWNILRDAFSEAEEAADGGIWITHEYEKYREDAIVEAMNAVAPYAESGNVEFESDGDHWRFHFENGTVKEQVGHIVYE